jgi:hypothetical protein
MFWLTPYGAKNTQSHPKLDAYPCLFLCDRGSRMKRGFRGLPQAIPGGMGFWSKSRFNPLQGTLSDLLVHSPG